MSQLKVIYNHDDADFIILSDNDLEISAIINRNNSYETNVFYQSINLVKRYPAGDNKFLLKDFILSSTDKIITKIIWLKDDGSIVDILEGNIEPQWGLSETPFIQEVINFRLNN